MKRTHGVFLAAMLLVSCVSARRITSLKMSDPSDPAPTIDLAKYEETYAGHNGVWLEFERMLEHVGGKADSDLDLFGLTPWRYYDVTHARLLVLNAGDEGVDHFGLTLDESAHLDTFQLRITYPDGRLKTFGLADLIDSEQSDAAVTKRLAFPDVTRGMVVELGYQWSSGKPHLQYTMSLQDDMPVEKLTFSYSYPDWWKIQTKRFGPEEAVPLESIADPKNRKKTIRYTATNVPAVSKEVFASSLDRQGKQLELRVTEYQIDKIKGFASGSWYAETEELREYIQPGPSSRQGKSLKRVAGEHVGGMTSASASAWERLRSIVGYFQDNVEIEDSYGRRKVHEVMRDKKGDIFAITGMARAILEESGIEANVALLHSDRDGYFDPDYIDLEELPTPAILASVDGRPVLIFPYLPLPPGGIPPQFVNQPALLLDTCSFVNIDFPGELGMEIEERHVLEIDHDGKVSGAFTVTFNDLMSYLLRSELEHLDEKGKKAFVEALLPFEGDIVTLKGYEILNEVDAKQELAIHLTHEIANTVTVTPEEVLFLTAGLFSPASGDRFRVVEVEERRAPIDVPHALTFKKKIEIRFPSDWRVANNLMPVAFENEFGSIRGDYTVGDGRLFVDQGLRLRRIRAPREKFSEFVELSGGRSKLDIPTLVFQPIKAAQPEP